MPIAVCKDAESTCKNAESIGKNAESTGKNAYATVDAAWFFEASWLRLAADALDLLGAPIG